MKTLGLLFCCVLCFLSARAQGTFRNLDFELAQIPSGTPQGSLIPVSTALPFWNVSIGSSQQTTVLYDWSYLGTAVATLQDRHSQFGTVLQGNYTVGLEAGEGGDVSIAQTGMIPVGTKSLLFMANMPEASGWQVTVGDIKIPVAPLYQVAPTMFIYVGDTSAFAGQTEQLKFTAFSGPSAPEEMILDAIQFSPIAVPEPSALGLLGCGIVLIVFRPRQ